MKRIHIFYGLALLLTVGAGTVSAQTVGNITARQRFPWNNLVDIDYTVEGVTDTAGLYLRFEIEDTVSGRICPDIPLEQAAPVSNGTHRVTWDPLKTKAFNDRRELIATGIVCRARLYRGDPERYLTIDLSSGAESGHYPVSYSPRLPYDGLNDTYRTTKLVMRKIEPGTFSMGCTGVGYKYCHKPHQVTLTKSFYIGLFEVTQKQWEMVTGNNPIAKDGYGRYMKGETRPVTFVTYNDIRGATEGAQWPASGHVDRDSFIGKLRERTGLNWIDLPTEAQWEYAGRAGTTTTLNSGKELKYWIKRCPNADEVGRYKYNDYDKKNRLGTDMAEVGSYLPNNWGLYDFHGNIWEFCLDWWSQAAPAPDAETDPVGPEQPVDADRRTLRSCGFDSEPERMTIGNRNGLESGTKWSDAGLRLSGIPPTE